jgi:two-component system, OmpR family, response regulator MprA
MSTNRPSQAPSRPRVLLADDDPAIRLLYAIWLSASGYDVDVAADGAGALNAVVEHGLPDAAVLDVNMPRVDGLAVCRSLRARSSRLPIVIVSALEEIEAAALVAGADVVLMKTAEREELCAALGAARSARRAMDGALAEAS